MAQGLDLGKMASRPSQEAVETAGEHTIDELKSDEKKMDVVAMRGAKRGENRMTANEERIPGSTIFSK
jgi:hypothetical protein